VLAFDRRHNLERLADEPFDVVVIGAGMTGAGVAVDAAQRGYRVALIDAGDVASGTSSKSSKMVHGGLRYLQQREFRLVYENLRERQRLLSNAPHLVRVLPFLIPLFGRDGVVSATVTKSYATALRLYDLTGGWRIGQRYRRVTRDEALGHLPTLKVDRLVAGFLYFDARGDDARVALSLAQTAAEHFGAVVATYVRATGFEHDATGRVQQVRCRDEASGAEISVRTSSVVNASGVWADDIFTMAEGKRSHRITPAKGVHVSVPSHRLPADVAAVLAVPGDRRSIFVVPFEEAPFTYVGTTDTAYDGELDEPLCEGEDIEYLLRALNAATSSQITPEDVTGLWAGLRPLLAPEEGQRVSERTADLSRRHEVRASADGVVHVTGGKWTTYRQMAEDAVDALGRQLGRRRRCRTASLALWGAPGADGWRPRGELATHLYRRFGVRAAVVLELIDADPDLGRIAIEGLPYVRAEFLYAARHEMAVTLLDLLTRRTRAHLMDARATLAAAESVAAVVADELGWDAERQRDEVATYRELVTREFAAAGLSLERETP
jgi:glycerol-3-phosphate dehydrogenase